jgi:hypothetical protein
VYVVCSGGGDDHDRGDVPGAFRYVCVLVYVYVVRRMSYV